MSPLAWARRTISWALRKWSGSVVRMNRSGADAEGVLGRLEFGHPPVDERPWLDPLLRRPLGDVDGVLIGPGEEAGVVAGHAMPAGDDVRADHLVEGMQTRPAVRIGDGRGQVVAPSVAHRDAMVAGGRRRARTPPEGERGRRAAPTIRPGRRSRRSCERPTRPPMRQRRRLPWRCPRRPPRRARAWRSRTRSRCRRSCRGRQPTRDYGTATEAVKSPVASATLWATGPALSATMAVTSAALAANSRSGGPALSVALWTAGLALSVALWTAGLALSPKIRSSTWRSPPRMGLPSR